MLNNKIEIFDNLRVVSILGVLFIHLSGWFLIVEPSLREPYLFLTRISRFSVPMFVFISAALFFLKYKNNKIDIKKYYLSRINKIVIPYIIVSAIYYLYKLTPFVSPKIKIVFSGWSNILDFFIKTLTIGTFSHLYFVPLIIVFYLLAPWILKLYKKNRIIFISFLMVLNISFVLLMNGLEIQRIYWRWALFPYLIYVAFGFLFANYYERIKQIKKENIFALLILVLAIIILIFRPYNTGTFELYGFSSYIYDSIFGLFWILTFLLINLPQKINRAISFLAQKSFGIYLFHYLLLDLSFSFILKGYINPSLSTISYTTILFFVASISAFMYSIVEHFISLPKRYKMIKEGLGHNVQKK